MIYSRWILGLGLVALAVAGANGAGLFSARAPADFEHDIRPVIEKNCASCHGEKKQKAGLSFESFHSPQDVRKQWRVWLNAGRRMAAKEMPPEDKPQPSSAERDLVLNWLSQDMFPVDANHPDPGRVTIRRLNRTEYNNTVHDLVGVDFNPADDFPSDDMGYGFDNIGDVLTVSPLLMEKYISAAEQVMSRAIAPPESVMLKKIPLDSLHSTNDSCLFEGDKFSLYKEGRAGTEITTDREGDYRIRIQAYGEMAGNEPPKMVLRLDGKEAQRFDVSVTEDSPKFYEFKTAFTAGKHRLAIAYPNNFRDPKNPNPRLRDRNLFITKIEIDGPIGLPPPAPPEAYRKIFFCKPSPSRTTNDCLHAIIGAFASRAYRRPISAGEIAALTGFAQNLLKNGASFEDAVRGPLTAVLVSPNFLFRGETLPGQGAPRGVQPIDEYALASRLSYFIWSTMPDETLFALAGKGKLRANLDEQVRRMLKDPKSREMAENFAGQWLQIRNLEIVSPDATMFPDFDDELRHAMRRETELFFADVLWADRSVLDFVNSDYSFMNERLAKFYGISGVTGSEFRRVSLKGTPRGGVFTQAGVLTVTSNPTRTSPVKRGKWVLDNLLNAPPPPPPANVPPFKEQPAGDVHASLRERMLDHRADAMCASCHIQMDALGFSFEHYDAIGRWRDKDGAFAIDDSCELNGGEQFKGVAGLRDVLTKKRSDQFLHCLTEKMLTYALGRGLDYYDMPTVDRICKNVVKADYHSSALVLEIVRSVPFQMRRGDVAGVAEN